MGDKTRGLYGKFHIERTDGRSAPGEKHEGCDYFVLDLTHDPFALPALAAYEAACRADYPLLAADLRDELLWRFRETAAAEPTTDMTKPCICGNPAPEDDCPRHAPTPERCRVCGSPKPENRYQHPAFADAEPCDNDAFHAAPRKETR